MEIDRLPVGVVSRIEGPTVSVELVRENEDHLATIFIRWYIVHVDRCVLVDQSKVSDVWYLPGCIGGDAVPTTFVGKLRRGKVYDHGVTSAGGGI